VGSDQQADSAYERGTSDPTYYKFAANNNALKTAYVRAMNPTGVPRIAERAEIAADGLLDNATSFTAYKTVVEQILREVAASKRAIAAVRDETDLETQLGKVMEHKGEVPGALPRIINKSDYDKLAPERNSFQRLAKSTRSRNNRWPIQKHGCCAEVDARRLGRG